MSGLCFQRPSLLIAKVWVPVTHLCVCLIHCKVHWRVGRTLGSCKLICLWYCQTSGHSLYKLLSVGFVGSVLSILTQFLSNRSQYVMADGVGVNWFTSCQECPEAVFWSSLLFLMHNSELFFILETKQLGYAYVPTLVAVVPSRGVRVTLAESLIRDLGKVSEWCGLWGIKLTASKTRTLIVSRSRTIYHQSPTLTIGGTVLKDSSLMTLYSGSDIWFQYMTFEKHLLSVSRAASQRLGILSKFKRLFHYRLLLGRCFLGFVLPVLSTVLQCGARLPMPTLNYWTV